MRASRTVKRTRIATTGFGTQFRGNIKDNHIQERIQDFNLERREGGGGGGFR